MIVDGDPERPFATVHTVRFSPLGGCTALAVDRIGAARSEVLVMAYGFTNKAILDALVAAKGRGVSVRLVADHKANAPGQKVTAVMPDGLELDWGYAGTAGSLFSQAAAAGIDCWLDDKHPIMHDKVMVIDRKTVLTGSFNWTNQAEGHNAENLLAVDDAALAKLYTDNWALHQGHSVKG